MYERLLGFLSGCRPAYNTCVIHIKTKLYPCDTVSHLIYLVMLLVRNVLTLGWGTLSCAGLDASYMAEKMDWQSKF